MPLSRPPVSPFDAQAAMEQLLARLRATAGATRVSVWVHDATTEMTIPFRQAVAGSGQPTVEHPQLRTPVPLGRSPFLSAVIRGMAPVVALADGRRAYDREIRDLGVRSVHGQPLFLNGAVVGVLTVEPAAAAAPHLLRQVGPKLAAAVAEAWARRAERRRVAQGEVLLRLVEATADAKSTDSLLASACRRLAELDDVERASVLLLEDGRLVPRMAGCVDKRSAPATEEQLQLAETALRTGEPMTADRTSGLPGGRVDPCDVGSTLAVPLGRTPHPAGVLTLDSTQPGPFPEDVRRLAAAVGALLGGAIDQARGSQTRPASLNTARVVCCS
ncbi:MAG TPA: GAF domain-containing protein [Blastococcus sp.]|nr:GAF domain-containing protein [Blastococcus sp.]